MTEQPGTNNGKTYTMDLEIEKFGPDNLDLIRQLVNEKLKELNLEGLKLEVGKCRYTAKEAKFELVVQVLSEDNDTPEKVINDFNTWIRDGKDDIIQMETANWKFMGYRSRNRKFPFVMLDKRTGKQYKMNKFGVRTRLTGIYQEKMVLDNK